jgi:hypothetical protein
VPLTPEQVHNLICQVLNGDPISIVPQGHDGSPDRVDANGSSKQGLSNLVGDVGNFEALAKVLSSPSGRLTLFTSTRRMIEKRGKWRPIDIPSEAKRFDQLAMLVFTLIPLVVAKDALDPRVVGFRTLAEFEKFAGRKDGFTIQDVFADTMFILIREHGPFILLIDLQDAYGNLPHQAIDLALKELLGLKHDKRRRIIESARIRTRMPNGTLLKPKGFGIEQGSPIAPLLFNLVQTLIARRLRAQGFESGCFGDDIGIAAKTEAEANRAFEVYSNTLGDLGFNLKKLRPLGDPKVVEKASFVYNARTTPLPLIKTYLMTIHSIGLTHDKVVDLISRLPRNPNLTQVRRANKWKAVTNNYLRRVLLNLRTTNTSAGLQAELPRTRGTPSPSPSPSTLCEDQALFGCASPDVAQGDQFTKDQDYTEMPLSVDKSTLCLQKVEDEVTTALQHTLSSCSPSLVKVTTTSLYQEKTSLASGQTAIASQEGDQAGVPNGGRMSVPRDGSEAGFTPGGYEAEEDGHPSSASKPVFATVLLREEHADALAMGHRLRVGDNYRPAPLVGPGKKQPEQVGRVVLDIRAASDRVPESRRAGAVAQLVRAASNRGRADLLVHPGDGWLPYLVALDGDGFRVRVREEARGVVVAVWKLVSQASSPNRKVEAPPSGRGRHRPHRAQQGGPACVAGPGPHGQGSRTPDLPGQVLRLDHREDRGVVSGVPGLAIRHLGLPLVRPGSPATERGRAPPSGGPAPSGQGPEGDEVQRRVGPLDAGNAAPSSAPGHRQSCSTLVVVALRDRPAARHAATCAPGAQPLHPCSRSVVGGGQAAVAQGDFARVVQGGVAAQEGAVAVALVRRAVRVVGDLDLAPG